MSNEHNIFLALYKRIILISIVVFIATLVGMIFHPLGIFGVFIIPLLIHKDVVKMRCPRCGNSIFSRKGGYFIQGLRNTCDHCGQSFVDKKG